MAQPDSLEERISHYEAQDRHSGRFAVADWVALALTGILFPAVCLLVGWLLSG